MKMTTKKHKSGCSTKNVKNIVIIGDSYSTFEGYIPNGFAAYYSCDTDDAVEGERFGIKTVEDTWWWQLADELSLCIVENNSKNIFIKPIYK